MQYVAPAVLDSIIPLTYPQLALWATGISPTSSADRIAADSNRIENLLGTCCRCPKFSDDDAGGMIGQDRGFSHRCARGQRCRQGGDHGVARAGHIEYFTGG